jgi:hypothetical protein
MGAASGVITHTSRVELEADRGPLVADRRALRGDRCIIYRNGKVRRPKHLQNINRTHVGATTCGARHDGRSARASPDRDPRTSDAQTARTNIEYHYDANTHL